MKIFKIEIDNYRLLKAFTLELEEELSLVIGKNNTGKTSILLILNKFLNQPGKTFSFDDFNIEFKKTLKKAIEDDSGVLEENYTRLGIKLRIYIEYNEKDNISNISKIMMDLDPDNNVVVLGFEYAIDFAAYTKIRTDFLKFKEKAASKKKGDAKHKIKTLFDFLELEEKAYFKVFRLSLAYDKSRKKADYKKTIDLDSENIGLSDIINFKYIPAKRAVTNKDNKTLSGQTSKIYSRTETSDDQKQAVENFKDTLSETDVELTDIYKTLFKNIVGKIRDFGGIKIKESEIEIISTLRQQELLEGNTTVVYKHDKDNKLPEHYNGLGYLNLISMIFDIEILVHAFKREKSEKPADINLLFIEEPEAHTHPQMQYVFIKNIKKLLGEGIKREDGENRDLQYIISTHSACIVADSDFDDIKYLKKGSDNSVESKNLKTLKDDYSTDLKQYQFLKQYLTISRAEIFFADKIILIEGDTERILFPTFMRKMDIEEEKESMKGTGEQKKQEKQLPLLSQNISIVEVGAHSQIYEKLIAFLGIKTLIITDIDSEKPGKSKKGTDTHVPCRVNEGTQTGNIALRHYLDKDWKTLKLLPKNDRTFRFAGSKALISYQSLEEKYQARSFEDAFIHINLEFIKKNVAFFRGIKNADGFNDSDNDAYSLATECIKKKTHFALDILYSSNGDLSNWKIPAYIKEGLEWLKED
jgi:predicted ATP-dependent endonuclease of OLD family